MGDVDVIVVGAGPSGLAAACALLMRGVRVLVVDKAGGPAITSRANFLHARGSEVLERIGALGDLPQRSVRAMRITTYLGDRPVMRIRFGDPALQTAAPPMVISQAVVEGALRTRLAALGGEVHWGAPMTDLRQDDSGVTATLGTRERVRAQWLLGCDGAGSDTRRRVDIGFPGARLSERFLLADVRLDWDLDRSGTTGWIHPDGMVGVMPMPDGVWRVIAYDPDAAGNRPTDAQILARLQRILPERTGRAVQVTGTEWLSMFSVHRRLADSYRRGRVFLVGDAAHTHAPFGGQGMLTGLGDAENLAWKLALVVRGRANPALLDTYEAERRPLATEVLRGTSAATKVNVAQGRMGRMIRDRVIVPLVNLPPVQRWVTYKTSQLWVTYRDGPLARRSSPLRRPRPGDRVPGLSGAELEGGWALTSADPYPDATLLQTAQGVLGDGVVALQRTDVPGADTRLIRPDAHLAWQGTDAEDLRHWLQAALTTGSVR